ncbi:hypothetical protein J2T13_002692 [Paenibacillus sp. DS2015]|uniref:hypothetical protein n=1 Tax=Paenibacillus sp. DS2015 TaxID=3373917 RepID=UPI003D1F7C89
MFDPTVFENLKVAFENHVYDLDNIDKQIMITNRIDRMELSIMSRLFALQFSRVDDEDVVAEIRLESSVKDLANEILELPDVVPGCVLQIFFYMPIANVSTQCRQIEDILQNIWKPELKPLQSLSYVYGEENAIHTNTIELRFNRKINEDQMDDIPELIGHVLQTLDELQHMSIA